MLACTAVYIQSITDTASTEHVLSVLCVQLVACAENIEKYNVELYRYLYDVW